MSLEGYGTFYRGQNPTTQVWGTPSGTVSDIEAIGTVSFGRSGNLVRIGCHGLLAFWTLTWGAKIEIIELPNA